MVTVSVVIPCYNMGHLVQETLDSVHLQSYRDLEVIIVNDGSDDSHTTAILKDLEGPLVRVIHTENQGLATARNTGIGAARGRLILPLDADDLIAPSYIEQAVARIDQDEGLGIVYCRAQLFGAVQTEWRLPSYDLDEMLLDNVIFCSALFRKSDWETVGGYDPGMIYGWEDYDFWLSLIELGRGVYQIPEILFCYRVASDSMIRSKERWQKVAMFKRIFQRHQRLFAAHIEGWLDVILDVREPYYTSRLYVDTGNGVSDAECVCRKVEPGTSEIHFSLEGFSDIRALRFDPIDSPAVIEIFKVVGTDRHGSSWEMVEQGDNSIFQVGSERYYESDDPQYFPLLSQEELQKIAGLTVHLSFKAVAETALQQIVVMQQQRLSEVSSHLEKNLSLGLIRAVVTALRRSQDESGLQYLKRQLRFS